MFLEKIEKTWSTTLISFLIITSIIFFFSERKFIIIDFHIIENLKIDRVRLWIILLSIFILVGSVFSEFKLTFPFYFIITVLFIVFLSDNILTFFFLFESTVLPIIYVILNEGKRQERLKAAFYIFAYMMFGSFPLLFFLFIVWKNDVYFFSNYNFKLRFTFFPIFARIILAFLVKIPVYFFHSWLPKAHVEASTIGSVFLASLLLKLGSFGLYRFLYSIQWLNFSFFFISLGLVAFLFRRMLCLLQTDLKVIIAFSSIVHIRLNIALLSRLKENTCLSFLLVNLRHSFISGSIFLGFGINYRWIKRRSNILLKGLSLILPSFGFIWLLVCLFNRSLPPSIGFVGEVLIVNLIYSLINESILSIFFLVLGFFFIGFYCLVIYSLVIHGKAIFKRVYYFQVNEIILIFFCVNVLIPLIFFSWIYPSCNTYFCFLFIFVLNVYEYLFVAKRNEINCEQKTY